MAAKKFLVPIDLNQNEIQNVVIQNLATFPSTPVAGQIVFRTSDDIHYGWDGTQWVSLYGSGSVGVETVTAGDGTITVAGTSADPTVAVTPAGLDHTYISDFDTQVRTSTLNQMAAPTTDLDIGSNKLVNVTDPTSAQDAATKAYVDAEVGSSVQSYAEDIGDNSTTAIVVTHNLGTEDITVSVRDTSSGAHVICDVSSTTTNTATFTFAVAPTTGQYRVVVQG